MLFFLFLALAANDSAEWNHLCKFGRVHQRNIWMTDWLNVNENFYLPVFEFKLGYQFSLGFISIKAKIHLSRASGLK